MCAARKIGEAEEIKTKDIQYYFKNVKSIITIYCYQ